MLDINRQKMFYSKQIGQVPVYDTDEDGNLKYITVDGNQVPIETGEYTTGYDVPVPFRSSISNKLRDFHLDQLVSFTNLSEQLIILLLIISIDHIITKLDLRKLTNGIIQPIQSPINKL